GEVVPRALMLTHIHLDHAGASGTLCERYPELVVYVHERGAPHLIDPSKLLESAARLYGDDMDRLWGEVAPVPEERVRPLRGGEAWLDSLQTIAKWNPLALCMTHVGRVTDVEDQLHRVRTSLVEHADIARRGGEEDFIRAMDRELRDATDAEAAERFVQAAPP